MSKRTHHPQSGLPVFSKELHDLLLETGGEHSDRLLAWFETVGYTKAELMWEFMYSDYYEQMANEAEQFKTAHPNLPGNYGSQHPVDVAKAWGEK